MRVKDLKNILDQMPDDDAVAIMQWNHKTSEYKYILLEFPGGFSHLKTRDISVIGYTSLVVIHDNNFVNMGDLKPVPEKNNTYEVFKRNGVLLLEVEAKSADEARLQAFHELGFDVKEVKYIKCAVCEGEFESCELYTCDVCGNEICKDCCNDDIICISCEDKINSKEVIDAP